MRQQYRWEFFWLPTHARLNLKTLKPKVRTQQHCGSFGKDGLGTGGSVGYGQLSPLTHSHEQRTSLRVQMGWCFIEYCRYSDPLSVQLRTSKKTEWGMECLPATCHCELELVELEMALVELLLTTMNKH